MSKKTIIIWNVSIKHAEKFVDLLKKDAQIALSEDDFETVEDIMYQINRVKEAIEEAKNDDHR